MLDLDPAFRPVPHMPLGVHGEPADNVLRLGLEPEQLTLELTGIGARVGVLAPPTLSAQIEAPELPAYAGLLRQVLAGDAALSIRGDKAGESWGVVTPVLDAWSKDLVPLEEYAAGSEGSG
jgi:glucose-6-phosphate 1-dehydrogenase